MRHQGLISAATVSLILIGCHQPEYSNEYLDDRSAANSWMVQSYYQDQIDAGIVRQAAIYPHHFEANSDSLNELGHRDVFILARHYRENPGRLNVARGDAGQELYHRRIAMVRDALAAHGVDAARLHIDDGFAGGDGATAERALLVLTRDVEPLSDDTGGFRATGIPAAGGR